MRKRWPLPALGVMVLVAGAVTGPALANDEAKQLWAQNCAKCHGETGKGDTKAGKMLKVEDLTDPAVRANFDRAKMIKSTKEGVPKEGSTRLVMKGFADKLTDAQIESLVDLIYSFGGGGGS